MEYVARTPAQLGQALKDCRKRRGLTQAAVGASVGLKQGTISVMERHDVTATVETLYKALSALGLELVLRDKSPADARAVEW
jgi:HTH-type transcriptional regulator / antitoxin HipB